jgi:hypothetical protein
VFGAQFREALDTAVVAAVVAFLALLPEWRAAGFYFHDDMQLQYVPAIVEIGRAARQGHFALLSEYSWFGGALAGEYQHGVFSIFHVLLCACVSGLTLPAVAGIVSVTYYALAGAGAYRAARTLEFRKPLALAVALVAALNGFNVIWGSWLPAITGWAWLMWLWWALERLRSRMRPRWTDIALSAFSTYSVLASGWHYADLLIPPLVLAVGWRLPRPVSLGELFWRFAVGPALGALLALPALLCFLEYARAAGRTDFDALSWSWTVPWRALQGLFVPLSASSWTGFSEVGVQSNVVMAGGVLPVVVVFVALVAPRGVRRREYAALLVPAALVLAWSMLPSLGRVRWPFRWLPVFHLLLVLAAARVITLEEELDASTGVHTRHAFRRHLAGSLVAAALIATILSFGTIEANAVLAAAFSIVALCALPLAAVRRTEAGLAFSSGVALNLVAAPLLFAVRSATPTWSTDRCAGAWAKLDHAALYLGVYHYLDIIDPADPSLGHDACVLPGNSSMVDRLTLVNGYSTLFVAGLHRHLGLEVHGELNGRGLRAVTGPLAAPGGLLERWGIAGLVLPSEPYLRPIAPRLSRAGFAPTEDLGGARIWRRGPPPTRKLLESLDTVRLAAASDPRAPESLPHDTERWTFDAALGPGAAVDSEVSLAELNVTADSVTPTRVEASVRAQVPPSSRSGLVLLRRPWLPGYRATLDGTPVVLGRLDDTLIGIAIPPGRSGRLKIEYIPLGVRAPALIGVLVALLVLGSGIVYELRGRSRA